MDLQHLFLNAIDKAKSSIFLSVFGLTDAKILEMLANKKEIPQTIYYDTKGSPDIRKKIPGAHPILSTGLMHQKILVLDEETVFLGSANFTGASLKMHDNLVIGFKDQELAEFLIQNSPLKTGFFKKTVGGQKVEITLLPNPKGLETLKEQIRGASKSLKLALFTLTHPELLDEIIAAKRRGVMVTVVLDLHSATGASAKALKTLQEAGINVCLSQGLQLMHHKFAYIDEKILITGSANWTKAAFTKNHDCLITLYDLNIDQRACMNRIWKRLEILSKTTR